MLNRDLVVERRRVLQGARGKGIGRRGRGLLRGVAVQGRMGKRAGGFQLLCAGGAGGLVAGAGLGEVQGRWCRVSGTGSAAAAASLFFLKYTQ